MYILMAVIFLLGYTAIALEHPIKINKAASAILTAVFCWSIFYFGANHIIPPEKLKEGAEHFIDDKLLEHLSEIASILFFLMGAMTIVELIDTHNGFKIITDKITSTNKVVLLWGLSLLTFFMSAALDNLTTSIVMATLLKKLLKNKKDLWIFAGVVVIAANAGGAWSPIGDVTTIMLWIAGKVTAWNIVKATFFPSVICIVIPLIVLSFTNKGKIEKPDDNFEKENNLTSPFERKLMLSLGLGSLLFVPVFKRITHLQPFMGILFGLGILWVTSELLHRNKHYEIKSKLSIISVLRKIDMSSVIFFLGILLAVASLQSAGHLEQLAKYLDEHISNYYVINIIIGFLSSVVDNVPLVAGAMGMYNFSPDDPFWEFLAYCAGTGGSCLIIGSAAGVAIMGIVGIDFIWYLKRISWLATLGYLAGAFTYIASEQFLYIL